MDNEPFEAPKELEAEDLNKVEFDENVNQDSKNDEDKENTKDAETSSERSESLIKEIPLSGERNRFSRSKSPKPRWHINSLEAKKVEDKEFSESNEESDSRISDKKRKWLGDDILMNKKSPLTISSETLKSFLPKNPLDNLDKQSIPKSNELDNLQTGISEENISNNLEQIVVVNKVNKLDYKILFCNIKYLRKKIFRIIENKKIIFF